MGGTSQRRGRTGAAPVHRGARLVRRVPFIYLSQSRRFINLDEIFFEMQTSTAIKKIQRAPSTDLNQSNINQTTGLEIPSVKEVSRL